MSEKRVNVLSVSEVLSHRYQLGLMRNVERELSVSRRKRLQNWQIVRDYMLAHTSTGGPTSCYKQCYYLGVDPEGYTFYPAVEPQ